MRSSTVGALKPARIDARAPSVPRPLPLQLEAWQDTGIPHVVHYQPRTPCAEDEHGHGYEHRRGVSRGAVYKDGGGLAGIARGRGVKESENPSALRGQLM